jgi:hypothetical protein
MVLFVYKDKIMRKLLKKNKDNTKIVPGGYNKEDLTLDGKQTLEQTWKL